MLFPTIAFLLVLILRAIGGILVLLTLLLLLAVFPAVGLYLIWVYKNLFTDLHVGDALGFVKNNFLLGLLIGILVISIPAGLTYLLW